MQPVQPTRLVSAAGASLLAQLRLNRRTAPLDQCVLLLCKNGKVRLSRTLASLLSPVLSAVVFGPLAQESKSEYSLKDHPASTVEFALDFCCGDDARKVRPARRGGQHARQARLTRRSSPKSTPDPTRRSTRRMRWRCSHSPTSSAWIRSARPAARPASSAWSPPTLPSCRRRATASTFPSYMRRRTPSQPPSRMRWTTSSGGSGACRPSWSETNGCTRTKKRLATGCGLK
jgi:hypothetical protein